MNKYFQIIFLCGAIFLIPDSKATTLIIGSKNFTEQNILSAITIQYLQKKGFTVEPRSNLSSLLLRTAMLNGQIDLAWEYTGTSLITYHHITTPMTHQQSYNTVKRLDARLGLHWLHPSTINNTYAFAMRRQRAEQLGIYKLSQLVTHIRKARQQNAPWQLGLDVEFARRSDGLIPFEAAYGVNLQRREYRQMEAGLVYNAIASGLVDAGLVYTTDGRIKGFDLLVLADDKQAFPGYAATPVVREAVLKANPGLAQALNTLAARLTQQEMIRLNALVDIEYQTPQQVAQDYLKNQGL